MSAILLELFHAPTVTVLVWLNEEVPWFLIDLGRLLEKRPDVIACGAQGVKTAEAEFLVQHMQSKGVYVHASLDDTLAQACRGWRRK